MIRFTVTTALAGLVALSAAGCAVEVPMDAFRVGPPDAKLKNEARVPQDTKHISVR